MSAHNTLQELLNSEYKGIDPGSGGTISVDRQFLEVDIVTAAAEARTLAQPTKQGLVCKVVLDTRVGNLTLTVTGGYNQAATATITFDTAGDWVMFHSVKVGTSFYWRVLAFEGVNIPHSFDDVTITDDLVVGDDATVTGDLAVTGGATIGGAVSATGAITGASSIAITGAAAIGGAVSVTGAATIGGAISAGSGIELTGGNFIPLTGAYSCTSSGPGVASTSPVSITTQTAFLNPDAQGRFFKMPTRVSGLGVRLVNKSSVTAVLLGYSTENVGAATSLAIATSGASGGSPLLQCDGTNWFVV